jgi:hypothetical protein
MVFTNHWNVTKIISAVFDKIFILYSGVHSKGFVFSELECSHSPGTSIWSIGSYIWNMDKIQQTVQALTRHISTNTYLYTYMHAYIHKYVYTGAQMAF